MSVCDTTFQVKVVEKETTVKDEDGLNQAKADED